MKITEATIGTEVVRSKGDYVVGRIGKIEAIDSEKNRAQVQWNGETKTWVSLGSIEPTHIPYLINPCTYDAKGHRKTWPKYRQLI